MGWFTKEEKEADKKEFLHVLKHGESSMRSEYEHGMNLVKEGCEIKRRLEDKVKAGVKIPVDHHLIIYDMDHHACEKSTVGYCATVRNYRTANHTDKEPCIFCSKMV